MPVMIGATTRMLPNELMIPVSAPKPSRSNAMNAMIATTAPTAMPRKNIRLTTPPSTMIEPLPQAMSFMVLRVCLR